MRNKSVRWLVVDTETTGVDLLIDRVVEFAVVPVEGDRVGAGQAWLVNPGRPIPPTASEVHHLVDRHVAGAPSLEVVLEQATKAFHPNGAVVVAHNAAFDGAFLEGAWKPRLCTLRLARRLWPDLEAHRNQFLRYHLALDIPEAEGLPSHRALADAVVTAHLLLRLLEEGRSRPELLPTFEDAKALIAWCWEPLVLTTCRFGKEHRGKRWADVPLSYLRWMARECKDLDPDVRHTVDTWILRHAGSGKTGVV